MANPSKEVAEHLGMLRDFPLNEMGKSNVEDLWKQLLSYRSEAGTDLAEAKARRAQAEAAREQAVADAVRNTQAVCQRIRASAERDLQEAKALREEMLRAKQQAEAEIRQAEATKAQAEQEAQRTIGEARGAAQDIVSQARMAAQKEANEFRQAVLIEIKHLLTRAENMSAALSEELETQRILSSIARIGSNAEMLLAEAAGSDHTLHKETGQATVTSEAVVQAAPAQAQGGASPKAAVFNPSLQEALQSLIGSIETSERAAFQNGSLRDAPAPLDGVNGVAQQP